MIRNEKISIRKKNEFIIYVPEKWFLIILKLSVKAAFSSNILIDEPAVVDCVDCSWGLCGLLVLA